MPVASRSEPVLNPYVSNPSLSLKGQNQALARLEVSISYFLLQFFYDVEKKFGFKYLQRGYTMENYEPLDIVGKGSFGTVQRVDFDLSLE